MNLFHWPFSPDEYTEENKKLSDEEIIDKYYQKAFQKYLEKRKGFKGNNLKLLFIYSRNDLHDENCVKYFFNTIRDCVKNGIKPSDIVYSFDNDLCKKTFSKQELANFQKIEKMGKKLGVTAGIFDYEDVFSYEEVKNADTAIKNVANKIKNKNHLTPFEKLLYAYLNVSSYEYKEENLGKESTSQSRSVYGVLNSDKIVCAGYSEFLKSIVRELEDPNLKVFANQVAFKDLQDDVELHQNNIVYIKDDKYKIDGFYYLDSTWDSFFLPNRLYAFENPSYSLNYFMTEIGQIKNIVEDVIDFNDSIKNTKPQKFRPKQGKSKSKFYHNYSYKNYTSVSKNKVKFNDEVWFESDVDNNTKDDFLIDYLLTRQDFKDYVILRQTAIDLKHGQKSNEKEQKDFEEVFKKNVALAEQDIKKLKVLTNSKEMFNYLKEHSSHVDIGQVHNALINVEKKLLNTKGLSKDEISKEVYDTLKYNIKISKKYNYKGNKSLWTECEDLEK